MCTTVTFEGSLAEDPQVRFTPSGEQITEITVLVNQRRHNSEWVDAEPTRYVVQAFKTLAESIVVLVGPRGHVSRRTRSPRGQVRGPGRASPVCGR